MDYFPSILNLYNRDHTTKKLMHGSYSMPEFEVLKDIKWVYKEKIDGTNILLHWNPIYGKIQIAGRRAKANQPTELWNHLSELCESLNPIMREKFHNKIVSIYGEGYGAGIQKAGKLYREDGMGFVGFDVRIGGCWLSPNNTADIFKNMFDLPYVPVHGTGDLYNAVTRVIGGVNSRLGGYRDFLAEGLVCVPEVTLLNNKGGRIIVKIKHKDFLNRPELSIGYTVR